jgi:hypothetical protein
VTIFGVPLEALKLDDVEGFLATADREPLTWEAKGAELRADQVTKYVAGFANAEAGGYLLLGFELVEGSWKPTGLVFPGDDPPVWVGNVVRNSMRPRPQIDVASWGVGKGKRAAVVKVDPVAEPPCVTSSGQLYERVSGETITVADPADLRALYERGRTAAERAEANALRALESVAAATASSLSDPTLIVVLSVGPTGTASDIASEVFTVDAVARIRALVDSLPREPHFPEAGLQMERVTDTQPRQDAVIAETTPDLIQMWRLRVGWDGSVAGVLRAAPGPDGGSSQYILSEQLFDEIVRPLAAVVEDTARGVGGHGRAHVAFRPIAWQFGIRYGNPFPATRGIPFIDELRPIQRWADDDRWLDDGLIESMRRELLRACGFGAWEPSPGGEAEP